jgi:fibronectin-binding autotransporter adhesin
MTYMPTTYLSPGFPRLSLGFLIALFSLSAPAATRTWTGAGANGLWTNPINWNGSVTAPVNGDGLVFPAGTPRLNATNAVGGVSNLLFLSFTGYDYVLYSPVSLSLTNGLTNSASGGPNTLHANLNLRASQTWSFAGKTILNLQSNLALGNSVLTLVGEDEIGISGNLTGAAGAQLLKQGLGRLTLNGPANSVPDFQVRNGPLTVNGVLAGSLSVSNGASVGGTGTVPAFVSAGSVSPGGGSRGVLTVSSGSAVFQPGGTLNLQLNGGTPGTGYDQLRVATPPNLAAGTLQLFPAFTPTNGQVFVIITNTGAAAFTTTFTNLPEGGGVVADGQLFQISYTGGDGNDVTLTKRTPTGVTRTWSGAGTNAFWSTPANWIGGVIPSPGDNLLFPGSAARVVNTNDLVPGTVFNFITLSNLNYTLRGNSLGLINGLDNCRVSSFQLATVGLPLTLLQPQTFTITNRPSLFGTITNRGSLLFTNPIFTAGHDLTLRVAAGSMRFSDHGVVTNGGSLILQGSGSVTIHNAQPLLPVQLAGVTLLGSGELGPLTAQVAGGRIMPIFSSGSFPLRCGNLTANANTSFEFELYGPFAGEDYTRMGVNGTVNLGNARLAVTLGFLPTVGMTFLVLTNDGGDPIVGTFAGLPEGSTTNFGLAEFQISYAGGDGNDVALTVTAVRPPGIWTGNGPFGGYWSDTSNWESFIEPGPTNDVIFPSGVVNNAVEFDYNTDMTYRSLIFTGSGYDIYSEFDYPDGLISITSQVLAFNDSGQNFIGTPLDFAPGCLVSNVIGSRLSLGNLPGSPLPVFSPAGTIRLGNIGTSDAPRTLPVIKRGPGRLELTYTFNYGTNWVEAGTLTAFDQLALGQDTDVSPSLYSSVAVSPGATLEITGSGVFHSPVQLAGRLHATAADINWNGPLHLTGPAAILEATNNARLNIQGALTGTNGLAISGNGSVRLLGAKTYTGPTTVPGGRLFATGLNTNSSVSILTGGTFSGTGAVGPIFCLNGTLAPGGLTNAGTLACNQGVTLTAAAQLRLRIFDSSGTNHDQLHVVGPVALNGVQLILTPTNFVAPLASSYLIISNDGNDAVVGTFAGLSQGAVLTVDGMFFQVDYRGGDGNDVVLTRVSSALRISGISPTAPGVLQIGATGTPGLPHVLDGATNLTLPIIWLPIHTNIADGLGNLIFVDSTITNFPQRYYRVIGP